MRFLGLFLAVLASSAAAADPAGVAAVEAPSGWMLLLAGVALAGWIAHRRLSYF